jgi:hypothetical protein
MHPLPFSQPLVKSHMSRTYQVQTDTSTRVRGQSVGNSISTTLRQTHHGRTKRGTDVVFLELLDFRQTDESPL